MKKIAFIMSVFFSAATLSSAQTKVETLEIKGEKFTVTKVLPDDIKGDILGDYKCNTASGEPIVELRPDGKGRFQRHDMPPRAIEYWVDCDENGVVRKQVGPTGNYGITIVYKELEGQWAGKYNLMGVAVAKDGAGLPINNRPEITGSYTVIFGERYKANR